MEFDSSQLSTESLDLAGVQRSDNINIASGDTISVTIGDHAHNIAIGKQITQIIQHFHTGDYATLRDLYVPPDSVYERVRTAEFIGRHWLIARIDTFLSDPKQKCGVLVVEGEAGVGKTAVMAHLVQERNYLHLFAEQLPGDANINRALQSLGSQIVARYQLYEYTQRDTLPAIAGFPDFLERLLRLVARKRDADEKIVIVCDALDEAGVAANGNVFGLPTMLPDGVYLLLAQRPQPVRLSFKNVTIQTIRLDPASIDNRGDVAAYLRAAARQLVVTEQLRQRGYSEDHFVTILTECSNGIWMYLQYVIEEIGRGERAPLDLDRLPSGLAGYYAEYWSRWRDGRRGHGVEKWDTLYAPLLATLAAVQTPLPLERLLGWAGVTIHKYAAQRLLGEDWRAFVTQMRRISTLSLTSASMQTVRLAQAEDYSIYHATLRDFISGKVDAERLTFEARAVVDELRQRTSEAHVRIVEQLRQQCSGDWLKLIADDYARLHLTTHLQAAGEQEPAYYEELYALVTLSNNWAQARYTKEESYAGYLVDLQRVWRQAESAAGWDVGRQIRCALIQSTIFSLADNLKPELLVFVVERGAWSAARALAQLPQIRNEGQRSQIIAQLAPYLSEGLLGEALAAAQAIEDDYNRAHALSGLIPHLSGVLKAQVISEALAAAQAIEHDYNRAHALSGLIPHLSEVLKAQVISEASAAAQAITGNFHTLSGLIPHLPEAFLDEVLARVQMIRDENWRFHTLSELVPHLPEALKAQVINEALAVARVITDELNRVYALRKLVPYLSEAVKAQVVINEALATAQAIANEYQRVHALSELAPYLSEALLSEALAMAHTIEGESSRVHALYKLIPYLSEALKAQVVSEALATALAIREIDQRADALLKLAPHLPKALLGETMARIQMIRDEDWRAVALSELASHLPEALKAQVVSEALATALAIKDKMHRANALSGVIPHLPEAFLNEMLAIALSITDDNERVYILSRLAPYLSKALLGKALASALTISDVYTYASVQSRVDVLRGFAPYVSDTLLVKALASALTISDMYGRADALSGLIPYLHEALKAQAVSEVLAVARAITDGPTRAEALSKVVPYLSEALKTQVINEALATVRALTGEYWRVHRVSVLSRLAPHLSEALKAQAVSEALATTQLNREEYQRADALSELAPHLPEALMSEALATALSIRDELHRTDALCELVPYLSEVLKAQAISETLAIGDKSIRAKALSELISNLSVDQQLAIIQDILPDLACSHVLPSLKRGMTRTASLHTVITYWQSMQFEGFIPQTHWLPVLRALSSNSRRELQYDLTALLPLIEHVGGQAAILEMLQALRDVAAWWP